jgi:hypothetical protein
MKVKKMLSGLWNTNLSYFKKLFESRKINAQKKYDYRKLYNIVHKESQPCFILSTGRCGTALLTKIFEQHANIKSYHTPTPELVYYSKFAYENHKELSNEIKLIIDAARYEHIRNSFLLNKTFVETNNRITFFAYQLKELFPKAKFIHLIRNPINFITSGMARNWYTGNNPHDEGHIIKNNDFKVWDNYSQSEKIAWLWNETNQFIEDFKSQIEPERINTIFAEDLFKNSQTVIEIFKFLNLSPISTVKISSLTKTPINKGNVETIKSIYFKIDQKFESLLPLSKLYEYSLK